MYAGYELRGKTSRCRTISKCDAAAIVMETKKKEILKIKIPYCALRHVRKALKPILL